MSSLNRGESLGNFHHAISFIEEAQTHLQLTPTQLETAVSLLVEFEASEFNNLGSYLNNAVRKLTTTEGITAHCIVQLAKQLHDYLESTSLTKSKFWTVVNKLKDGAAYKRASKSEDFSELIEQLEELTSDSALELVQNRQFYESVLLRVQQTLFVKFAFAILPAHVLASSGKVSTDHEGIHPGLFAYAVACALARMSLEFRLIKNLRPTSSVELVAIDQILNNRAQIDEDEKRSWKRWIKRHKATLAILNVRVVEMLTPLIIALVAYQLNSPGWAQATLAVMAASNTIGFLGDVHGNIGREPVEIFTEDIDVDEVGVSDVPVGQLEGVGV